MGENGGGRGGDRRRSTGVFLGVGGVGGMMGKSETRWDAESKESLFSYWEWLKLVFQAEQKEPMERKTCSW